jgi:hypothetical protein
MQFSKYANYFICYSSLVPSNVLSGVDKFPQLKLSLPSQEVDNLGNEDDKSIIAEGLWLSRL